MGVTGFSLSSSMLHPVPGKFPELYSEEGEKRDHWSALSSLLNPVVSKVPEQYSEFQEDEESSGGLV